MEKIEMDVTTLLTDVAALKTSAEALIAKASPAPAPTPAPDVDLQPVADAIQAIKAEIDAALNPAS